MQEGNSSLPVGTNLQTHDAFSCSGVKLKISQPGACNLMPSLVSFHWSVCTANTRCLISQAMRFGLVIVQVQHWLGLPKFETTEQAEEHAAQLVQLFAASQPLVTELDAKERGHADELLVLAAASLLSAADVPASDPSERPKRLFQVLALPRLCLTSMSKAILYMPQLGWTSRLMKFIDQMFEHAS